jgi:hypothetical protein
MEITREVKNLIEIVNSKVAKQTNTQPQSKI